MDHILHITSGDMAGDSLKKAGLAGDIFVWHDILYDGPRRPGWPDKDTLRARALFLEAYTGGGLKKDDILKTLVAQYEKLATATYRDRIVLWFDACLFDQSMLCHILTCLHHKGMTQAELLCVDTFPGIAPYHGLGQLQPEQLFSCYAERRPVRKDQFEFAARADRAFATQDPALLRELSERIDAPIPWVPAAAKRWMQEQPGTGLGLLEEYAMAAMHAGCETPRKICRFVADADAPPRFWGDTTLWGKINGLADREPPLVKIVGPADRLPQWGNPPKAFKIKALP